MKLNISPCKGLKKQRIEVTIIFIFMLIGLFSAHAFLKSHILNAIETDESWREALGKSLLFQELSNFRSELEPKSFIPEIFNKLENELIYSGGSNNHFWNLTASTNSANFFTGERFVKKLKSKLKQKGLSPSLVFAFDSETQSYASLFKGAPLNKLNLPLFLKSINRQCQFHAKFPLIEILEKETSRNWKSSTESPPETISRLITVYKTKNDLYPNEVNFLYTDKPFFEKLLLFFSPIIRNNKFYGFYGVILNESNISPKTILATALKKPLAGSLKRCFFSEKISITREIAATTIPLSFSSIIYSGNRSGKVKTNEIKLNSYLAIEIDKIFFCSPYKKTFNIINLLFSLSVIFLASFWFKSMIHGIRLPFRIRIKFTLLITIIVVFPNIFIYFFSNFSAKNLAHLKLTIAKNKLENKISFIEELITEGDVRHVVHNFELKKKLAKEYILFKNRPLIHFKPEFQRFNQDVYNKLYMMDLNGLLYQPDYQEDRGSKNILTVNSMTSLLQNLGILNLNSETAKDRLTKARLTGGLVEDYMKLLNQAEILAAESENTFHLSALNFVERMILFLIPDIDSNSFLPFGVCIAQFSSDYFFSQLFKNQEGFPHKVFSFSESGYNFEVTVGRRNHFAITEESIFGKNNCSKKLTKLLHSAFHLKSKDLVVKRFEKETFIGCWKYLHNKRLVLAGSCSFSNEDLKQLNLAFLPWLILTYSILVLLLLSKTLTRIFISPLDALVEGALRVDVQEDYETRIASSSNDEFDDLISSFNNMNKGLQEKKHMARFLSNQLLTNINEELETTDAKSIKKIEAAIIFSDIRNFTTISETNPPEEVVELLNEYFSCMEKAILENGGTIEKFIGDAILATFTSSFPEKKEEKACLAAMEMKKQLQKFNQNRKQNELFEIENGVGISTGEIYSGSLGVAGNMEFVLSGDKIELASNLEATSKFSKHLNIVVSKEVKQKVGETFIFGDLKSSEIGVCYDLVGKNNE